MMTTVTTVSIGYSERSEGAKCTHENDLQSRRTLSVRTVRGPRQQRIMKVYSI